MLVILNMYQHGLCTTSHIHFCIASNSARNFFFFFLRNKHLKLFVSTDFHVYIYTQTHTHNVYGEKAISNLINFLDKTMYILIRYGINDILRTVMCTTSLP